MPLVDQENQRIMGRVLYWGPRGAGKTTSLEHIYARTATEPRKERTAGHDLVALPLSLGTFRGWQLQLMLWLAPAQSANTERVLHELREHGPDVIVFVASSSAAAQPANAASYAELSEAFRARGWELARVPLVLQANHADAPDAVSPSAMAAQLGLSTGDAIPSQARLGVGVFDVLKAASRHFMLSLRDGGRSVT